MRDSTCPEITESGRVVGPDGDDLVDLRLLPEDEASPYSPQDQWLALGLMCISVESLDVSDHLVSTSHCGAGRSSSASSDTPNPA